MEMATSLHVVGILLVVRQSPFYPEPASPLIDLGLDIVLITTGIFLLAALKGQVDNQKCHRFPNHLAQILIVRQGSDNIVQYLEVFRRHLVDVNQFLSL
jgi:hypothetical protein